MYQSISKPHKKMINKNLTIFNFLQSIRPCQAMTIIPFLHRIYLQMILREWLENSLKTIWELWENFGRTQTFLFSVLHEESILNRKESIREVLFSMLEVQIRQWIISVSVLLMIDNTSLFRQQIKLNKNIQTDHQQVLFSSLGGKILGISWG